MLTCALLMTSPHSEGHDEVGNAGSATELGSFLMCPAAVDGNEANNRMFSPQSIAIMSKVMHDRAGCFEKSSASTQTCGNFQREGTEKCDCGGGAGVCPSVDVCCTEQCMFNEARGAVCSPNNEDHGACCSSDCTLLPANTTCREQSECTAKAVCTADGECPKPGSNAGGGEGGLLQHAASHFRPPNSLCETGVARCSAAAAGGCAGLCNNHGECSRSICELWNRTLCMPTPGEASNP